MFQHIYDEYVQHLLAKSSDKNLTTSLKARRCASLQNQSNGFNRISLCRKALNALDSKGWQRSYHQKLFHETFMRACARVFWKTEKSGKFAQDHQKILETNGWDHLSQEILVSTPRR
jgi:hypothetical protein